MNTNPPAPRLPSLLLASVLPAGLRHRAGALATEVAVTAELRAAHRAAMTPRHHAATAAMVEEYERAASLYERAAAGRVSR